MKVLLIDVNCKKSSTGKIVYDLYQRLRDDGNEAAICYGRGNIVEGENIFKFGIDLETIFHAGLARITGLNGYYSYFSTKRLIRFVEEYDPDVIHIHELHAYFVNIKQFLRYLKKKGKKIVWTFHCEYMYTGKCGHAYDCQNWKRGCGKCPAIREYPKSFGIDFTKKMLRDKKECLNDMDFTIVTPSNWLANRVKESFLRNKKIVTIHNGIDSSNMFYPRTADEISKFKSINGLENKKIVLSVAPDIMSESKGGQTVLRISEYFKKENVQFVLVGANESKIIGSNVRLIQRTANQDELAYWYSAADVFLICSKRENFPTTCLEALCCGTPIVGIDSGGTKETAPVPYGSFCKPGDINGLVQALDTYLNQNKSDDIFVFGRKQYNKDKMYSAYLELYNEGIN